MFFAALPVESEPLESHASSAAWSSPQREVLPRVRRRHLPRRPRTPFSASKPSSNAIKERRREPKASSSATADISPAPQVPPRIERIPTPSSGSSAAPMPVAVRNHARGRRQQTFHTQLQATPIDVSALLPPASLFDAYSSVILTSATLTSKSANRTRFRPTSPSGSASPPARELIVPSHFDYGRQALLYLPPNLPDPREPVFFLQAAERMRRVLEITRGRAFCLFTSLRRRCARCTTAC